jgi:hypothetical protein
VPVTHRAVDDGVEVEVGPADDPVELVVLGAGPFSGVTGAAPLREVPGGVAVAVDAASGAVVRLTR